MEPGGLAAGTGDRSQPPLREPVPTLHTDIAIPDIGAERHLVHGAAHRHVLGRYPAFPVRHLDAQTLTGRQVLCKPRLVGTAFEAVGKIARGVGREFRRRRDRAI
jgi:hypothetical protein